MRPRICNYYVTLRCNSKCSFCNIWRNKENSKIREQTLDEVENNLRALKKLGVKLIDFTGGEPLLYSPLIDVLKLAKKMKFYTSITTNCLLYPKYASKLRGLVDILQFSFESVDADKHNKIRGVNSHHKVIRSIEIAKKIKQKVYLLHTVTNGNIKAVPRIVKFAQENRCTLVLNPCFEYFGNSGLSKKSALALKKQFNQPYIIFDLAQLELIQNGGNDVNNPLCKAISSTIVISPDNYLLLPCYHHYLKKIKISNNLFKIYNSKEVTKMRKLEGRFKFCKNCTIYCYMRSSLYLQIFSKYSYLSTKSAYKYLRERLRRQF